MPAVTEHYEVWFTAPDGARRHQRADDLDTAATIAGQHAWADMTDVEVLRVVVTATPVQVALPPKSEA